MDYLLIVSNVGMAVMMLVIYFRYSRFRILSASEIKTLRNLNQKGSEERKLLEEKLLQATKGDGEKVEKILRDLDALRQEKDVEVRLRVEAEKQLEVSLVKLGEIQKRMDDWRLTQDAAIASAKDSLFKIGNDLYKKISDSYKLEIETHKNLFGRLNEKLDSSFEKLLSSSQQKEDRKSVKLPVKSEPEAKFTIDLISKKLVLDLVGTMKAAGKLPNKDYFIPANFDEQKAKMMLCEIAFLDNEKLYIIDFKACNYFEEVKKSGSNPAAQTTLKQKLDKYFAYISNEKYHDSITKVMSLTKAKFSEAFIITIVPSKAELNIAKQLHYYEKAHQLSLEMMDFDEINNLIL
jgi:hypothetical protein